MVLAKCFGGGGGDTDGDDNFMPTKKAAATKASKPVAPPSGASRARPKPKGLDDEIGFGKDEKTLPHPTKKCAMPVGLATRPPPPPPRSAKSCSDIEMADNGPPLPWLMKALSSTAKDEDDAKDSGDDLVQQVLEKAEAKATATRAGKLKL